MQDMSLSQIAEFGFLKLAKAFEWTWQERKGSEVGKPRQAGRLPLCSAFFMCLLILQLCWVYDSRYVCQVFLDGWTNLSGARLSVQKVSKFSVASIRYGDDPSRYS